jgi:GNAT superfamily N-acetyltransferase
MALMGVSIRRLERSDARDVLELAKRLGKWFNEQGLSQMQGDLAVHDGLVAHSGGRLVGFVTWNLNDAVTANLSWMGVEEPLRRTGIGRALLAAMIARVRDGGVRVVEVSTVADSVDYAPYADTRAFYRAMGFVDSRVDERFFGEGSDRYDRLVLRRDIGPGSEPEAT